MGRFVAFPLCGKYGVAAALTGGKQLSAGELHLMVRISLHQKEEKQRWRIPSLLFLGMVVIMDTIYDCNLTNAPGCEICTQRRLDAP